MIIGIFGTGMMGSSIGLRSRRNGDVVIGYDHDAASLQSALACGAIDKAVTRDDLYERSEIVVIAAHLDGTLAELLRLRDVSLPRDLLVCDIASTKVQIWQTAREIPQFIPTHPMAGNERSGPGGASATLFDERTLAYVPTERNDLVTRLRTFIASQGGIPFPLDAQEHDRLVATTSHLPQICASVFSRAFSSLAPHESAATLCGPTAREFLRLSASRYAMWGPILSSNRAHIEPLLRDFSRELKSIADALESGDDATIQALFS